MTAHETACSFAICQRITRQSRSNFSLAFRLLPPHKRRAMDALYAFMRITDDLADEPGEVAEKRLALSRWREALTAALRGDFAHPIHPALHDTALRFAIPPRFLFDAIDGAEADLEPVRFATFAELYPYCYRVASAVGLACIRIWELRRGAAFADADPPAEAAGIAFQLTNIIRDLGEDLSRGRVYLPQDELTRFGCPPESWTRPDADFATMMRFLVNRARDFYRRSEPLDALLAPDGRAIFRVMSGTYRALLDAIERNGFDVFSQRVRVPRWRKGLLVLRAWPAKWNRV